MAIKTTTSCDRCGREFVPGPMKTHADRRWGAEVLGGVSITSQRAETLCGKSPFGDDSYSVQVTSQYDLCWPCVSEIAGGVEKDAKGFAVHTHDEKHSAMARFLEEAKAAADKEASDTALYGDEPAAQAGPEGEA